MIPMVMRLRATEVDPKTGRHSGVNLWLPLFLVWILALPLALLIFLAWAFCKPWASRSASMDRFTRTIEAGAAVLGKIDGLRIDVRSRDSRFILHF